MENISEHNPTLAEVADAFLSNLPPEERGKTQAEVSKFVRWLGLSRRVKDISPVDVASYGELITPSAVKPLRAFLTYIRKKRLSSISLAPHLRAKKTSPKTVAVWQSGQVQATLTAQGYAKLEEELADLKSQRSQITEEIKSAAADKDFRENAPLAAARERKARLEGRIKEIESILDQAKIMGEDQDTTRAKFGDTVVLRDLSSGKEFSYTLVNPREANPAKGKLSVASPLGKAILGKEKGQAIEVVAPAGIFCCRIEDILVPSKASPQ
ncbi:MAG: transcription elongation factor GreA [Chloroflexi bacterium]|nr:transcription elongation factor GreA [Chloroflexota bacterium]